MSEISEYTTDQLRSGIECLSTKFGTEQFLGAPAGLLLSREEFPKMLKQLCAAGFVEKTSEKQGQDFFYRIVLEQRGRSLVTSLPVAKVAGKKASAAKPSDLEDYLKLQRKVIELMEENSKLRIQVAALTSSSASMDA